MEPAQLVPAITAGLTVLGSAVAAFGADRAPRQVRLLARLAEAAGHVGSTSPGGAALDVALRELAEDYAAKARARRDRKLNWAAVTTMTTLGGLGAAFVYGLSMLALWLGSFDLAGGEIALAVVAWLIAIAVATLTISMVLYGIPKLYDHEWSARALGRSVSTEADGS